MPSKEQPRRTALSQAQDTFEVIHRFQSYIDDVLSGRITACKKVIKAVQRHQRDIARMQSDPHWRWTFDPKLAARPVLFMEQFLTPMKGDYDHMTLLGWQIFCLCSIFGWVDKKTRLRRFREALILVGRGNGKSTMMSGIASFLMTKDG